MATNLLVDMNNLAFITRFSILPKDVSPRRLDKNAHLLVCFSMLKFILDNARKHKCDGLVIAADSPNVWRKDFYPEYKLKDENEDPYYPAAIEGADLAFSILNEFTAAYTLKVPRCEGDDILGWWCQNTTNDVVILSNDSDYKQLHNARVRQYSPTKKEFVVTEDASFELFEKCIRGDRNDNIFSAYPRVRGTLLQEAHRDKIAYLNLMETVTPDGKKVGDKFEFNKRLIDLSMQPDEIKQAIRGVINRTESGKLRKIAVMQYIENNLGVPKYSEIFDSAPTALKKSPKLTEEI